MTVSKSAPFWRCQLHRDLQVHHATLTLKVANSRVLGAGLLPRCETVRIIAMVDPDDQGRVSATFDANHLRT